jgi:isoamylase
MLIEIRRLETEVTLPNLTLNQLLARAHLECHGVKLHRPDWSYQSHSLAISASAVSADLDLYLVLNAYWEPLRFELPPIPEDGLGPWRRWLNTFLESPDDICPISSAPLVAGSTYLVNPRSIVALARIAERFGSGIGSKSVQTEV